MRLRAGAIASPGLVVSGTGPVAGDAGGKRFGCGDCGVPLTLGVRDGSLAEGEGVVHFAVPARRWWENIGFT